MGVFCGLRWRGFAMEFDRLPKAAVAFVSIVGGEDPPRATVDQRLEQASPVHLGLKERDAAAVAVAIYALFPE